MFVLLTRFIQNQIKPSYLYNKKQSEQEPQKLEAELLFFTVVMPLAFPVTD